jgi:hypothetical protein
MEVFLYCTFACYRLVVISRIKVFWFGLWLLISPALPSCLFFLLIALSSSPNPNYSKVLRTYPSNLSHPLTSPLSLFIHHLFDPRYFWYSTFNSSSCSRPCRYLSSSKPGEQQQSPTSLDTHCNHLPNTVVAGARLRYPAGDRSASAVQRSTVQTQSNKPPRADQTRVPTIFVTATGSGEVSVAPTPPRLDRV